MAMGLRTAAAIVIEERLVKKKSKRVEWNLRDELAPLRCYKVGSSQNCWTYRHR